MRISYKGDYALKTILDLTFRYKDGPVHIEDISKRQDIPLKFLEQILLQLKKGKFVNSKKGPSGGYYLARRPSAIYLGEVLRYIEGDISPISCVGNAALEYPCDFKDKCGFIDIWNRVDKAISGIVDKVSFESIRRSMKRKDECLSLPKGKHAKKDVVR